MSGKLWFPLTFNIYGNSIAIIIECLLYAKHAESWTWIIIISFNPQNNWWDRYSYYLILQKRNLRFREIKRLSPSHRWRVAELGFESKPTDFTRTWFGFPQATFNLLYNQGTAMPRKMLTPPARSHALLLSLLVWSLAWHVSPSTLLSKSILQDLIKPPSPSHPLLWIHVKSCHSILLWSLSFFKNVYFHVLFIHSMAYTFIVLSPQIIVN